MKHYTLLAAIFLLTACAQNNVRSVSVMRFERALLVETTAVLDVRTHNEYHTGHIPGAICVDLAQPDFIQQVNTQIRKDQVVAVYCQTGNRSKKAAALLAADGYKVVELDQGIKGWIKAGMPILP